MHAYHQGPVNKIKERTGQKRLLLPNEVLVYFHCDIFLIMNVTHVGISHEAFFDFLTFFFRFGQDSLFLMFHDIIINRIFVNERFLYIVASSLV